MKLLTSLNEIFERLGKIDANLEEHMRRSKLAEEALEVHRRLIEPMKVDYDARQAARRKRREFVTKVAIAFLSGIAVALIIKLLPHF